MNVVMMWGGKLCLRHLYIRNSCGAILRVFPTELHSVGTLFAFTEVV